MKYPLRNEYDTAIRNLDKFVFDDILKLGNPVTQAKNPHLLRSYNGGKAIVYEIQTNDKRYALKCWVEDLGDLKIRYKEIDAYLNEVALPYFVDFSYKENGILVGGQRFPTIRMEWVDGISFKQFITDNISNPVHIRNLAEQFLEMVKALHQNNISHGDLQHGNIMIRKNGHICLIDYDSLYVPQLMHENDNIKGLPGYQHPHRNKKKKLSPKADYFSELVIYLSLIAISVRPDYWKSVGKEERLFFSETDLLNPSRSPIFTELKKLSPEIGYLIVALEKFCQVSDIEHLQPLEDIVAWYASGASVSDVNVANPPITEFANSNAVTDSNYVSDVNRSSIPNINSSVNNPINSKVNNFNSFNSTNIWDKFDTNKPNSSTQFSRSQPVRDVWDKFGHSSETKQPVVIKNQNIWDKFFGSIASIWRKFVGLFARP